MRRLLALAVLLGISLARSGGATGQAAVTTPFGGFPVVPGASEILTQSYEEALAQDLALIAEARGWTVDEAWAYYRNERAIGQIAATVAARRPEAFVGSALSTEPAGAPTLFVKGVPDELVVDLVEAAEIPIIVDEGEPFSFAELEDRAARIHGALQSLGFGQVVTAADITASGVVVASVTREPGLTLTSDEILAEIPADLRSGLRLSIHESPIVEAEGAFGGMQMIDWPWGVCTSGWTVQGSAGTRGISTAGHCTAGIDNVDHKGHGLHATLFKGQHQGAWGDVEWHTTTQTEVDDFYADATTIRDVNSVEPRASISVNESICGYGRGTNERDCTLEVLNVSMNCGSLSRLVQMNGDTLGSGDSGGGWSMNFTAYGGHMGNCGGLDSFTAADLFDEAIGVFVPTS